MIINVDVSKCKPQVISFYKKTENERKIDKPKVIVEDF